MAIKVKENFIEETLTKHIDRIYPNKEALRAVLESGKKLTIYWGIDPTSPHIHLGHSTNFFVLRRLQNLGHKIIILIGDFTARIGDPSGKTTARVPLTKSQIIKNFKNYRSQIIKILDSKKTVFKSNSAWWNKMKIIDFLMLEKLVTHQQIIGRDMFQKRIADNNPISEMEIQYPLLQGYDSVALKVDIEVGGTDGLFNMMMGRELEKTFLKKEKFVITTPLLENPKTGNKLMSKSEGNYISMDDNSNNIYGKVMALSDEVILTCFKLCTDVDDDRIKNIERRLKSNENPRNIKSELAYEIVKIYHGEEKANEAEHEFNQVFQKHELPEKISEVILKAGEYDTADLLILAKMATSKSEARRLIAGGAVKIDGRKADDFKSKVKVLPGSVIQVGKRHFVKIKAGKL